MGPADWNAPEPARIRASPKPSDLVYVPELQWDPQGEFLMTSIPFPYIYFPEDFGGEPEENLRRSPPLHPHGSSGSMRPIFSNPAYEPEDDGQPGDTGWDCGSAPFHRIRIQF